MALDDYTEETIKEAELLHIRYLKMSFDAGNIGQHEMAAMMKAMADDEREHIDLMHRMHTSMHASPEMMRSMRGPSKEPLDYSILAEQAVLKGTNPDYAARLSVEAEHMPSSFLKGEERRAALLRMESARMELRKLANEPGGSPGSPMMSQEEADRLGMGEMHRSMMGGGASHTLFPKTTGDWSDLAGRIKDANPQSLSLRGEVNLLLSDIYEDEDGATDSKRKLFDLAISYGIS